LFSLFLLEILQKKHRREQRENSIGSHLNGCLSCFLFIVNVCSTAWFTHTNNTSHCRRDPSQTITVSKHSKIHKAGSQSCFTGEKGVWGTVRGGVHHHFRTFCWALRRVQERHYLLQGGSLFVAIRCGRWWAGQHW
jgi:hypothetical protein